MDAGRRRMLVALALAPAAAPGLVARAAASPHTAAAPAAEAPAAEARAAEALAAAAPPAPAALPLRVGEAPAPAVPGPTLRYGEEPGLAVLRVRRDVPTRIALDNRLSRPTSLDLHGLRMPAALGGGGPLCGAVAPGTVAEVAVRAPDSGTVWFHPGILDPDRDETAAGLAGILVVEDAAPPAVDADLAVLLTGMPAGAESGAPSVDWGQAPRRETLRPGARVRLRLVNGSTRRAVTVACVGAETRVLAIDGQPSALFRPRGDAVPLGPGSRCDLVFDLGGAAGSEVRVLAGPGEARAVALVLRAEGEPMAPRGPFAPLPPNPALPEAIALERATRATLVAAAPAGRPDRWTINGASGLVLQKAPLFRAKRGAPVALTLRNEAAETVGFRLHGFCFRQLHDLDDGWQPYWLDSLLVRPGATHHIAFVADQPGRWLIQSPFFAQAAGGLRTWFEVS